MYERRAVAAPDSNVPPVVTEALKRFASLSTDWDSYGADQISSTVLERADRIATLLYALAANRGIELPVPKVVVGGDGSVGFAWQNARWPRDLEVAIDKDSVEFVASREGEVFADGPLNSAEELLAEIQAHILSR